MAGHCSRSFHSSPAPITEALLLEAVRAEELRVLDEDDIPTTHFEPTALPSLQSLRLSFKQIPSISNLLGLGSLRELRLDNNNIKKIENLDQVPNLEWLDLSFNQISRIEGLDHLPRLRDLSLYNNNISKISGLDACNGTLEVLSLGANNVADLADVLGLRACRKLRVLNLRRNPVAENKDYTHSCLAYLPQLRYLDYAKITDEQRQEVREGAIAPDELQALEEADQEAARKAAADAADKLRRQRLVETVSEGPSDVLDAVFTQTDNLAVAKALTLPGVEAARAEMTERASALIQHATQQLQVFSQQLEDEAAGFQEALRQLDSGVERAALTKVHAYRSERKRILRKVNADEVPDARELLPLHGLIRQSVASIRASEVVRLEQARAMLDTFEASVKALQTQKLAEHEHFYRTLDADCLRRIKGAVADAVEALVAAGPDAPVPDGLHEDLQPVAHDAEVLSHARQQFEDAIDSKFTENEDALKAREADRCRRLVSAAQKAVEATSRRRLKELEELEQQSIAGIDKHVDQIRERTASIMADAERRQLLARSASRQSSPVQGAAGAFAMNAFKSRLGGLSLG